MQQLDNLEFLHHVLMQRMIEVGASTPEILGYWENAGRLTAEIRHLMEVLSGETRKCGNRRRDSQEE